MNNHGTKPSMELSDGEYRDDEGLLTASKEDEGWNEGQKTPPAARQRNAFTLWTILLLSLGMNFSQTWWLAGDAVRHSCKAFGIAHSLEHRVNSVQWLQILRLGDLRHPSGASLLTLSTGHSIQKSNTLIQVWAHKSPTRCLDHSTPTRAW